MKHVEGVPECHGAAGHGSCTHQAFPSPLGAVRATAAAWGPGTPWLASRDLNLHLLHRLRRTCCGPGTPESGLGPDGHGIRAGGREM